MWAKVWSPSWGKVPCPMRHLGGSGQAASALEDQWPWGEADGLQGGRGTLRPERRESKWPTQARARDLGTSSSELSTRELMIHLWPISAGLCLEIPTAAPSLGSGALRIQSHLHLAENISPTLQGTVFTITTGGM